MVSDGFSLHPNMVLASENGFRPTPYKTVLLLFLINIVFSLDVKWPRKAVFTRRSHFHLSDKATTTDSDLEPFESASRNE